MVRECYEFGHNTSSSTLSWRMRLPGYAPSIVESVKERHSLRPLIGYAKDSGWKEVVEARGANGEIKLARIDFS